MCRLATTALKLQKMRRIRAYRSVPLTPNPTEICNETASERYIQIGNLVLHGCHIIASNDAVIYLWHNKHRACRLIAYMTCVQQCTQLNTVAATKVMDIRQRRLLRRQKRARTLKRAEASHKIKYRQRDTQGIADQGSLIETVLAHEAAYLLADA